jgi:hypothetical protein
VQVVDCLLCVLRVCLPPPPQVYFGGGSVVSVPDACAQMQCLHAVSTTDLQPAFLSTMHSLACACACVHLLCVHATSPLYVRIAPFCRHLVCRHLPPLRAAGMSASATPLPRCQTALPTTWAQQHSSWRMSHGTAGAACRWAWQVDDYILHLIECGLSAS